MRTLLSQLDTAKWSDAGLKARLEMLSSGPFATCTSLLSSPCVEVADEAAVAAEPKRPDMVVLVVFEGAKRETMMGRCCEGLGGLP